MRESIVSIGDYNCSYSFLSGIDAYGSVGQELRNQFSFISPSFLYSEKKGKWDGRIRLIQQRGGYLFFPSGLKHRVAKYLNGINVPCVIDDMNIYEGNIDFRTIKASIEPREYQKKAIEWILRQKRGIIVSATSSGKTLVAYFILHKLAEIGKKTLFIVPRVDLVKQLYSDFEDYGSPVNEDMMTISTWQSLQRRSEGFFAQFDAVYVDEVHLATANVLKKIVLSCVNADWRIGQTGSLDKTKAHALYLVGLFGEAKEFVSVSDLIQMNFAARTKCNFLVLKSKHKHYKTYNDEIKSLLANPVRNMYMASVVAKVSGNSFFMTKSVDHARKMASLVSKISKKKCFVMHATTPKEEREKVYSMFKLYDDCVLFATFSLISTGLNITNLDNLFIGAPIKSFTTHIQSIGRVIRKNGERDAIVYDFIDEDVSGKRLYSFMHGIERIKHIIEADIPVEIREVSLINEKERNGKINASKW